MCPALNSNPMNIKIVIIQAHPYGWFPKFSYYHPSPSITELNLSIIDFFRVSCIYDCTY